MSSIKNGIDDFKNVIKRNNINPTNGLGQDLFLFASTLLPIINVDILVVDAENKFLLSWRDDEHCGKGWHIPGGCLRLKETLMERIHACAIEELGADVEWISSPIMVNEGICNERPDNERCHFVSILYICKVRDLSELKSVDGEHIKGNLKWFSSIPDDMLEIQGFYVSRWNEIKQIMEEI